MELLSVYSCFLIQEIQIQKSCIIQLKVLVHGANPSKFIATLPLPGHLKITVGMALDGWAPGTCILGIRYLNFDDPRFLVLISGYL